MKQLLKYTFLLFFITHSWSCQLDKKNKAPSLTVVEKNNSNAINTISTPVKTVLIQQKPFVISTMSTGTLKAQQHTTIHLKSTGTIIALPIEDGQYIKKGQLLAMIDDAALQLELEQQTIELLEREFEKKSLLVANGGEAEIDSSVSPKRLASILIRSGYRKAEQTIKQTQFRIAQTKIIAPFSGLIADLEVEEFQEGREGQQICRLLNPNTFEAEFQLTEAEALPLSIGQQVQVKLLADESMSFKASIQAINPIVNEQGLVTIRAKLRNTKNKKLLEGMAVRVAIERSIPNQFVIPKEALVLRSGKEVVFTYDSKEKLAKWKYVEVAFENATELAIKTGLQAGDLVIIEGNLNLSHDAKVVLE